MTAIAFVSGTGTFVGIDEALVEAAKVDDDGVMFLDDEDEDEVAQEKEVVLVPLLELPQRQAVLPRQDQPPARQLQRQQWTAGPPPEHRPCHDSLLSCWIEEQMKNLGTSGKNNGVQLRAPKMNFVLDKPPHVPFGPFQEFSGPSRDKQRSTVIAHQREHDMAQHTRPTILSLGRMRPKHIVPPKTKAAAPAPKMGKLLPRNVKEDTKTVKSEDTIGPEDESIVQHAAQPPQLSSRSETEPTTGNGSGGIPTSSSSSSFEVSSNCAVDGSSADSSASEQEEEEEEPQVKSATDAADLWGIVDLEIELDEELGKDEFDSEPADSIIEQEEVASVASAAEQEQQLMTELVSGDTLFTHP